MRISGTHSVLQIRTVGSARAAGGTTVADRYDLVIVGMGSGGMVAAEFAATLDLKVAVAERSRVGGDCLWTGCVPSKALLAAGKVAHHMRTADDFGIEPVEPKVDRGSVWKHIRSVQQEIASTDDNPERYEAMGVDIVYGAARLTGKNTVQVGDRTLETRYVLLCTGRRPAVPPIEGLEEAGFVTSENLFELDDPPASFVNVGGGPIAVEMVQGFTRLGIPVTLLQKGPRILPKDEPALVDVLVDNRGRTNVDTIYACGDLAGRFLFTHSAAYEGVRAVRDMFFPGKGKVVAAVPWCTFTDPELAHTGLTEAEAREQHGDNIEVWHQDLEHNDRARADGASEGAVMIITDKKKIVGAHILAPAAGEMIHEFALAIEEGVKLSELSQFMHVYPTLGTSVGQLAGDAAFEKAEKLRWLVKRK